MIKYILIIFVVCLYKYLILNSNGKIKFGGKLHIEEDSGNGEKEAQNYARNWSLFIH